MNLQSIKAALHAEVRKFSTWVKTGLLIALPFAADIKATLSANLPALQPYLPDNIYKFMGAAVVVTGMVLSFIATHRSVKAADEPDNA